MTDRTRLATLLKYIIALRCNIFTHEYPPVHHPLLLSIGPFAAPLPTTLVQLPTQPQSLPLPLRPGFTPRPVLQGLHNPIIRGMRSEVIEPDQRSALSRKHGGHPAERVVEVPERHADTGLHLDAGADQLTPIISVSCSINSWGFGGSLERGVSASRTFL